MLDTCWKSTGTTTISNNEVRKQVQREWTVMDTIRESCSAICRTKTTDC